VARQLFPVRELRPRASRTRLLTDGRRSSLLQRPRVRQSATI